MRKTNWKANIGSFWSHSNPLMLFSFCSLLGLGSLVEIRINVLFQLRNRYKIQNLHNWCISWLWFYTVNFTPNSQRIFKAFNFFFWDLDKLAVNFNNLLNKGNFSASSRLKRLDKVYEADFEQWSVFIKLDYRSDMLWKCADHALVMWRMHDHVYVVHSLELPSRTFGVLDRSPRELN